MPGNHEPSANFGTSDARSSQIAIYLVALTRTCKRDRGHKDKKSRKAEKQERRKRKKSKFNSANGKLANSQGQIETLVVS